MGVYGNLLNAFPELLRNVQVFTKLDKSDIRTIRAVFMPTRGDRFQSQKYTSRGKAIQYFEDDSLFVSSFWCSKIDIGDYFYEPIEGYLSRIVGRADWNFEGGFTRFTTERVTGSNDIEHTEELRVKEAEFA